MTKGMDILLYRGAEAGRLAITPAEGELIVAEETSGDRVLYVGDAATGGGQPVGRRENRSHRVGFATGRRYCTHLRVSNTTIISTIQVDQVRYVPFFVPARTTFVNIGFQVEAAVASSLARVGVYDDLDGVPNNLLMQTGDIDTSTIGVKAASTSSLSLEQGLYWLASIANHASMGVRAIDSSTILGVLDWKASFANLGVNQCVWSQAQAFASGLPDPAVPDASLNIHPPMIFLEV